MNFTYDDIARLTTDNCGSVWSQTFSYDQYDNLTKSGSMSWNPGYNTKNQYSSIGATYDASGFLTDDGTNHFSSDIYGKLTSINSGTPLIYDALGRVVEEGGKLLVTAQRFKGLDEQSDNYLLPEAPAPGAGNVLRDGATSYYMASDYLGSLRTSQIVPAGGKRSYGGTLPSPPTESNTLHLGGSPDHQRLPEIPRTCSQEFYSIHQTRN